MDLNRELESLKGLRSRESCEVEPEIIVISSGSSNESSPGSSSDKEGLVVDKTSLDEAMADHTETESEKEEIRSPPMKRPRLSMLHLDRLQKDEQQDEGQE